MPVPLGCQRPSPPPIVRGQEIFTLAAPLRQEKGWTSGVVSRVTTNALAVDLTLAAGGLGGPVFTASGDLVGVTTFQNEREDPKRGAAGIVRIERACEAIAVAVNKAGDTAAPSAAHLPVEPMQRLDMRLALMGQVEEVILDQVGRQKRSAPCVHGLEDQLRVILFAEVDHDQSDLLA
jgi:hypothetical protein